jgi:hypothetical protein
MGVYELSGAGSVKTGRTLYTSMNAGNMYGAMVPIGYQITTNATTGGFNFLNIPQIYQDLVLISVAESATGVTGTNFSVNGNGSSGLWSVSALWGTGSIATSGRATGRNAATVGGQQSGILAGAPSITINHILNYTSTNTFKTVLSRYSQDLNGSGETDLSINMYRDTNPITQINVSTGNSWATGSTFTLYGIRAANS